jgi:hypothetical protein
VAVSIYRASVPVFTRGLSIVSRLLDRTEAHAAEKGDPPFSYIEARLAADMLALAGQVQHASDTAKFSVARLTGTQAPPFADDESTFDRLRERCARTIEYLNSVDARSFEGAEVRTINFGWEAKKWTLRGGDYLFQFGIPNFFFHVTTTYDILRHKGVPVGKRDFLGSYDGASST